MIPNNGPWTYQNKKHKPLDAFWIAKYPITRAQFQTFVDDPDGFRNAQWWQGLYASKEYRAKADEQWFKYWNHPRDEVSWWDAMAFSAWLTAKATDHRNLLPDGIQCRNDWRITLPTEQQWKKAARGHDGRRYPWGGDDYRSGYANIDEINHKVGSYYLQKTSAVGMYPQGASPDGVEDLSGNVWEWCLNEYDSGKTDPGGNAIRVLRGGSWLNFDNNAAAPFRFNRHPVFRARNYGFRVVVVGWRPNAKALNSVALYSDSAGRRPVRGGGCGGRTAPPTARAAGGEAIHEWGHECTNGVSPLMGVASAKESRMDTS